LLSACFRKPCDAVFHDRRFFREPPRHRWLARDDAGRLVAQLAVHERAAMAGWRRIEVAGVAEVCVHPDYRGKGLVKTLFSAAHPWLAARRFAFAMLFGDPKVYASSGYTAVSNIIGEEPDADGVLRRKALTPLVRPLASDPWPAEPVLLPGLVF